ncbi:hypothetical protein FQN60_012782 [Etheostoma spectabile]|uniref:Uncharacterized protein n=1 Tax=Etheostoma spectabile TaxID=54343 RepID=A0A5J5D5R5_9PERO|nr:hypothetical protein FQN60_012782 [Etheostoma spectabile]
MTRAALVSFRRSRRRAHKKDRGERKPCGWSHLLIGDRVGHVTWVDHGRNSTQERHSRVDQSEDPGLCGTWLKALVGPQRRQPPFGPQGFLKEANFLPQLILVDPFTFEHLQSNVDVVDLLQTADGWQTELGRQTPLLDEELHHTPGSKHHMKDLL